MYIGQVAPEADAEHLALQIGDAANFRRSHKKIAERIHRHAELDDFRALDRSDVTGGVGSHEKLNAAGHERRHRARATAEINQVDIEAVLAPDALL